MSRALRNHTSAQDAAPTPAQLPIDIDPTTDSSDDQKQPQSVVPLNRSQQRQLRRHGMEDCNPTSTPMDAAATQELTAAPEDYKASATLTREYQAIIGGLMFAAICSRPDIAFAVNRLSRYCANPTDAHYAATKRVLRYLKGTVNHRIIYTGTAHSTPHLVGYCDADWAQDKDCKRRVHHRLRVRRCVEVRSAGRARSSPPSALSSTEAELMAITSSTKELLWYRHHLAGIGLSSHSADHAASRQSVCDRHCQQQQASATAVSTSKCSTSSSASTSRPTHMSSCNTSRPSRQAS